MTSQLEKPLRIAIVTCILIGAIPLSIGPRAQAPALPPTGEGAASPGETSSEEAAARDRIEAWLADGNGFDDVFRKLAQPLGPSVAEISSRLRARTRRILGTVIDAKGLIVTKSSEVGAEPRCVLNDGREFPAKVLVRSEAYDLALLEIAAADLVPVSFAKEVLDTGSWVLSVGARGRLMSVGVVSVPERNVRPPRGGYLGIRIEDDTDGGARVSSVDEGSAAANAGLLVDDVIFRIGDKPIANRVGLVRTIIDKAPGDQVRLRVRRGEGELTLEARLGLRPELSGGPSRQQRRLAGGSLSSRRTRFPGALTHDGILRATRCGGPVLDVQGRVIGVNIARADRTHSLALSGSSLSKAITELRAKAASAEALPKVTKATPEKERRQQ